MALIDKLTAIADAIRSKTGGTEALTLDDMAEAVANLSTGGDTSVEDSLITRTLTEYSNDRVTTIGGSAFRNADKLTAASFPNVTRVESYAFGQCGKLAALSLPKVSSVAMYAFSNCSSLATVDFPLVTTISSSVFSSCTKLTTARFPKVTSVGDSAFYGCAVLAEVDIPNATYLGKNSFNSCRALTRVDFPLVTTIEERACEYASALTTAKFPLVKSIGTYAFRGTALATLVIEQSDSVCTLSSATAFYSTPIESGTGYIYVPDALVEDYKAAKNWSTYAAQIKPLSEYVEA